MSITILRPGALSSIQDLGRFGQARMGYTTCGACDKDLFRLANLLLGNHIHDAAIEFTLTGPTVSFANDTLFCVTGDVHPRLGGIPMPPCTPCLAHAGDVLEIGTLSSGLRGYLALQGGIQVPEVLGSRSTDLKCGFGGLEGRKLQAGDVLPLAACHAEDLDTLLAHYRQAVAQMLTFLPEVSKTVHVLLGPQDEGFSREAIHIFFSSVYTVEADSNRMGLRLSGEKLTDTASDILSDGILEGNVQVSSNGQPILMMADHPTTGGYRKIATLIPTDLHHAAQWRPGEKVRFKAISYAQALTLYRQREAQWQQLQAVMEGAI